VSEVGFLSVRREAKEREGERKGKKERGCKIGL